MDSSKYIQSPSLLTTSSATLSEPLAWTIAVAS